MPDPTWPDQELTSKEVAVIAEAVDGTRDKPLFLVWNDGKFLVKEKVEPEDQQILTFSTQSRRPDRPRLGITVKLGNNSKPLTDCDALFWTESAVEKFFWPYYHSQRLFDADLQTLWNEYYKQSNILAIGHVPPSRPKKLDLPQGPADSVVVVAKRPGAEGEIELTSLRDYLARK